jgi:phytoene synthase
MRHDDDRLAPRLEIPSDLRNDYRACRALTRRHGTTYYWATRLLPASRRPHVYALYGFCRHADDIVDDLADVVVERRARALADLAEQLRTGLDEPEASDVRSHAAVRAVLHTARTYGIEPDCFERFLTSMTMDLTIASYATWRDLCGYMDGSAAVIGELMLPILEPLGDGAVEPARDLGLAFQLTNFLRDVGEDLERGRVYLPQEDLERFGTDPRRRTVDDAWRELMQFEIDRARNLYRSAQDGIAMLPAWAAPSIATAHRLYSQILDAIEANDYDVFVHRARVSTARKITTAARAYGRRR